MDSAKLLSCCARASACVRRIELRSQIGQKIQVRLLFIGKRTDIAALERGELGVLRVKVCLRLDELRGEELSGVFSMLLPESGCSPE